MYCLHFLCLHVVVVVVVVVLFCSVLVSVNVQDTKLTINTLIASIVAPELLTSRLPTLVVQLGNDAMKDACECANMAQRFLCSRQSARWQLTLQ